MTLDIERAIVTPGGALADGPDFLQLRAQYHVVGEAGGERVDFTAFGAAETFRGRSCASADRPPESEEVGLHVGHAELQSVQVVEELDVGDSRLT